MEVKYGYWDMINREKKKKKPFSYGRNSFWTTETQKCVGVPGRQKIQTQVGCWFFKKRKKEKKNLLTIGSSRLTSKSMH